MQTLHTAFFLFRWQVTYSPVHGIEMTVVMYMGSTLGDNEDADVITQCSDFIINVLRVHQSTKGMGMTSKQVFSLQWVGQSHSLLCVCVVCVDWQCVCVCERERGTCRGGVVFVVGSVRDWRGGGR